MLSVVIGCDGHPHTGDIPRLMNRATLVLIPSRSEGLPNVAKEAGLMARPVVATRVGGVPVRLWSERDMARIRRHKKHFFGQGKGRRTDLHGK